jgi:5'-3' exonuclease
MGIKYFFKWVNEHFRPHIQRKYGDIQRPFFTDADVLMLDMNSIIHNFIRAVYFPPPPPARLLKPSRPTTQMPRPNEKVAFAEITRYVEYLVRITQPKKVVLCIDGPAPIAKQNQQRGRRFKSARDRSDEEFARFDTNSITPGTAFMDSLSRYIHHWISTKVQSEWKELEVIFSNEKVPGEGEQKLIQYIRVHGKEDETYIVHGIDADIIMLCLATHKPKMFILRETMMPFTNEYYLLNIGAIRNALADEMRFPGEFCQRRAINDFVFLCFFIGNDFLPQIPSIEVLKGGIDTILAIYRQVGQHLTVETTDSVTFLSKSFRIFLTHLVPYEVDILKMKASQKELYHEHNLLDDPTHFDELYSSEVFGDFEEKYALDYLDGMQWVLSYYTRGVPNWEWAYRNHYSPLVVHLHRHIPEYKTKTYKQTQPTPPFLQLMCVLPPKSFGLLPLAFKDVYPSLPDLYPPEFDVDMRGKRKDWEGIPLIPFVHLPTLKELYRQRIQTLTAEETKRNIVGKSSKYTYTTTTFIHF